MPATQGSIVTVLTPTIAVTPELALMPPTAVTPTTAVTQETAVCPQGFAEIHEKSFKWHNFILLILRVAKTDSAYTQYKLNPIPLILIIS